MGSGIWDFTFIFTICIVSRYLLSLGWLISQNIQRVVGRTEPDTEFYLQQVQSNLILAYWV